MERGVFLSARRNGTYNIKQGTELALKELFAKPIITDEFCRDHFNCSLE